MYLTPVVIVVFFVLLQLYPLWKWATSDRNKYGALDWGFVYMVTAMIAFVLSLGIVARGLGAVHDERQCDRYEAAMRVETTFERWTYWSYDCFVQLDDGTRVELDQYRGIAG